MRVRIAVALVLPGVLICGGTSGATGQQPAVKDSGGVRLVTNPSAGQWRPDQRPTVRVVARISGVEGDPDKELGDIVSVAIRSNGNLVALDRQARLVREFDPSGRWVRNLGRPGNGPGEFSEGVDGLWLGTADTLNVADVGAQRIVRFADDGSPAGTVPIPFGRGIAYEWRADTTGRVLHRQVVFEGRRATGSLLVARDRAATVTDTLLRLPMVEALSMGAEGPVLTILAPETVWDVGEDGTVAYGVTDSYRIRRTDRAGRVRLEFTWPASSRPLSAADRELYREAFLKLWEGRFPPRMHAALRQNAKFAERLPAFAGVRAGPQGTTWVQEVRRPAQDRGGPETLFDPARDVGADTWNVFAADGSYLGPVTFPPRFTPLLFRGALVVGVSRDSLDLQSLLRIRLDGFRAAR